MDSKEFHKMREEQKKKEAKMTPEEKAALEAARKRHAEKVREEIITSYVLDLKRKERMKNEEE